MVARYVGGGGGPDHYLRVGLRGVVVVERGSGVHGGELMPKCYFKDKCIVCLMGDQWPCRGPDCPPIVSQSKFGRINIFSNELLEALK